MKCFNCNGSGFIILQSSPIHEEGLCPVCKGTGGPFNYRKAAVKAFASDGAKRMDWKARALVAESQLIAERGKSANPSQWAYDQACAALHKHRERADKAEAELARRDKQLEEAMDYQVQLTAALHHRDAAALPTEIFCWYGTISGNTYGSQDGDEDRIPLCKITSASRDPNSGLWTDAQEIKPVVLWEMKKPDGSTYFSRNIPSSYDDHKNLVIDAFTSVGTFKK